MPEFEGLQRLYSYAREQEPTSDEVERALRRADGAPTRSRRHPAFAVAFATVALVVVLATSALAGAFGTVESFLTGGATPGAAISADQYPVWLNDVQRLPAEVAGRTGPNQDGARLLAMQGDERLYAYRERGDGAVCFAFGHHVTSCDPDPQVWRSKLDAHAAAVLMTAPGTSGTAVFGIARSDAASVEITYTDGSTGDRTTITSNGFVFFADPTRTPSTLLVYGADGSQIDRVSLNDRQWKFCAVAGPSCG
jgi:hypothetical protein